MKKDASHGAMRGAFAGFLVLLVSACAGRSPPVEFYTLHTLAGEAGGGGAGRVLRIEVGPITFPELLNRSQIVTRTSPNRIDLAEFHRWGGSFQEEFSRVLSENLSILLGTSWVLPYPAEAAFEPTYRLGAEVIRFDGQPGGEVELKVRWLLQEAEPGKLLLVRSSLIREPVEGTNYEALVAAEGEALAELAREMAAAIQRLQSTTPP